MGPSRTGNPDSTGTTTREVARLPRLTSFPVRPSTRVARAITPRQKKRGAPRAGAPLYFASGNGAQRATSFRSAYGHASCAHLSSPYVVLEGWGNGMIVQRLSFAALHSSSLPAGPCLLGAHSVPPGKMS